MLHITTFSNYYFTIIIIISILLFSSLIVNDCFSSTNQKQYSDCINYNSEEKIITIECKSANLTDIYNQFKDSNIIQKETDNGIWSLNAGIVIEKDARFFINFTDTSWLKIFADGKTAHSIIVLGSLKIDSVKITSWNSEKNDYGRSDDSKRLGYEKTIIGTPRPYITIEEGATGTTDIINSEIAYLGYEAGWGEGRSGLRYESGDGSVLAGNNIHHMWFAFYSVGVSGIIIEDNYIHHNGYYGIDPHTGSHDMIIRNNTVYNNGAIGIICSLDCYNILIEDNNVFNNSKSGITFSRSMYDSVARNNYVHDGTFCIVVNRTSYNNEIYNNTIVNCENGIAIKTGSFDNYIHNNKIINSQSNSILTTSDSYNNKFYYNTIVNARVLDQIVYNEKDLNIHGNNNFEKNNLIRFGTNERLQ